jgi:hypothetical protein
MKTNLFKIILSATIVCSQYVSLYAQEIKNKCGFKQSPEMAQISQKILNTLKNKHIKPSVNVITIPLVVHVMEPSTTGTLITDSKISEMITNLNYAFEGTGTFAGNINSNIRFELAKIDPNCMPTTAINRIIVPNSNFSQANKNLYATKGVFGGGVTWAQIESLSDWNKEIYTNIWIVNRLDNGAAGVGGPQNGLIVDATALNTDLPGRESITPHEVAHYFNLLHPFSDENGTCGCTDGDGLSDTAPLQRYSINGSCTKEFGCTPEAKALINPCTNMAYGDIQNNIMNYSVVGCAYLFTPQQAQYMRTYIETYKTGLINSPVRSLSVTATVSINAPNTICTSAASFPTPVASCICSSVQTTTINGMASSFNAYPLLTPGSSMPLVFGVVCANGLSTTKTITFYKPGLSISGSNCTANNTYSVAFTNPNNYTYTVNAGNTGTSSITNIPSGTNLTITVTDQNGCIEIQQILAPCCNLPSATCTPTAPNGLSNFFGISKFEFLGINKTSGTSLADNNNYVNNTCNNSNTASNVEPGSHPMKVTAATVNRQYVKVWIDFNNSGVFETSELVLSGNTAMSAANEAANFLSGMVTIPTTAVRSTPLRVRVMVDQAQGSTACIINGLNTGRVIENFGSGQIEDYAITLNPSGALPLTFSAVYVKNNTLHWTIENPKNVEKFQVEYSGNEINFETLGTTTFEYGKLNYSQKLPAWDKISFVRIKSQDTDGSFTYSKIVTIVPNAESPFLVVENPSKSTNFRFTSNIESPQIQLLNLKGQNLLYTLQAQGNNQYLINTSAKGPVLLQLKNNSLHLSRKIIIVD